MRGSSDSTSITRRASTIEPLAARCSAFASGSNRDFRFTPDRLTPGYEHRLSRKALAATYAVFAVGLALGALLTTRRGSARPR